MNIYQKIGYWVLLLSTGLTAIHNFYDFGIAGVPIRIIAFVVSLIFMFVGYKQSKKGN